MKYAFIRRHEHEHSVRRLCKIMTVHPSGYYAWKAGPVSPRVQDDRRLLGLLKHAWLESGGVYGYRKLTLDMRDLGETCGKHRVARSKDCARRPATGAAPVRVVDNAVAESFFQLLKRERIRRQIYPSRDEARADVFNYIEMFYNPKRRHGTAGDTSPVEFERRHSQRLKSV